MMSNTSISTLCEEIAAAATALKLRASELLEQLADLDAAARESFNDPWIDGRLGTRCPTQEARDGLRCFILDELHLLAGVAAPRREIYFIEGRKVVNGPAVGTLAERVLRSVEKLEIRIERRQRADAQPENLQTSANAPGDRTNLQTSAKSAGGPTDLQTSANLEREESNLQTSANLKDLKREDRHGQ